MNSFHLMKYLLRLSVVLLFSFSFSFASFKCANPKSFTPVYSGDDYSKLVLIGNTSLCANDNKDGICEDPENKNNNNIYMINNDYDTIPGSRINSSGALLDIPAGKKVLWAGLMWQGYLVDANNTVKSTIDSVKLRHESDVYRDINTPEMNWVYFNSARFYYQGYVEVTDYVNTYGNGYYWVADIISSQGSQNDGGIIGGGFGAWSLAVVYQDNDEDFNNITVYHGYQAIAGTTDVDNAKEYAKDNHCSQTNTGLGSGVETTLSGFLTPKEGEVKSRLVVFAGEGDVGLPGDSGYITKKDGSQYDLTNSVNPKLNIMNATISVDGSYVTTGKPYYSNNSLGIDIDTYNLDGVLGNTQSSTKIGLTSTGDGYMPGLYAIETQLYVPKFCYDYSYKQDGSYFTEENDGSKDPSIVGNINASSPVKLSIYIKNKVDSDIQIQDFSIDFYDIDTDQLRYKRESTYATPINSIFPQSVSDSSLNVSDSHVNGLYIGSFDTNDYFYLYYSLDPSRTALNMPINIRAKYKLKFEAELIDYTLRLGSNIEMCSDANFRYQPKKGLFNIVHANYYDYDFGGTNQYYNLPAQVVNRPGNFKLVSFDENDLDEPKETSTPVLVEIIDASAFHDIEFACNEVNNSIGDRQWVDLVMQKSIGIQTSFPRASKNATFRISYNTMSDQGDDIVQTERLSNGNYKMLNFPYLAGEPCTKPTLYPLGSSGNFGEATQVSQACGNAGNQGITKEHLHACMECIYGKNTTLICSRDNFSIRPEAFNMQLRDTDQILDAVGGIPIANDATANLAAGYGYDAKIDAVTHTGNNPSSGYNSEFITATTSAETFYGFEWTPDAQNVTGCNDTADHPLPIKFNDGSTHNLALIEEVGIYQYHIQDKTWTNVDKSPSHQTGIYFTGVFDCLENESLVQSSSFSTSMVPNYNSFLNGCDIVSNHTNVDTGASYNDYLIEFHPYNFNVTGITPTVGLNNLPLNNNTGFIYMADVNDDNITVTGQLFRDMSLQLNGPIIAEGANNVALSNFVDNCFAQPLDVDLTDMVYAPVVDANGDPINYQFRLLTEDDQAVQVRDTGAIIYDPTLAYTSGMPNIPTLETVDFAQTAQGQTDTTLLLNFDRAVNIAANPQQITFNNYNVGCTTPANCTFTADMNPNATATGTQNINAAITHYYARSFTPRQSYTDFTGIAPIFYEVYCDVNSGCDTTLLQSTNVSQGGDSRWRINTNHTANYGLVTNINQKNAANVAASGITLNSSTLTYNNNRGRPYTATMQHQPNTWLVYNPYDATATTNEFEAEFIGGASDWAGQTKTDDTTQTDGSQRTNRRLVW